jgi:mannose-6-phosphate isomerase class I
VLGPAVTRQFEGRLPYLLKVLSAKAPLSIQAHPSKEAAQEGFARENAAGVPLTARHRNYRDDNHKPELLTALTDFYGLRGFRPLPEMPGVARKCRTLQVLRLRGYNQAQRRVSWQRSPREISVPSVVNTTMI